MAYFGTLRVVQTTVTDAHNGSAHGKRATRQGVQSTAGVALLCCFVDELSCQWDSFVGT